MAKHIHTIYLYIKLYFSYHFTNPKDSLSFWRTRKKFGKQSGLEFDWTCSSYQRNMKRVSFKTLNDALETRTKHMKRFSISFLLFRNCSFEYFSLFCFFISFFCANSLDISEQIVYSTLLLGDYLGFALALIVSNEILQFSS